MCFYTGEFEVALATCRRVAKPLTFSGCRACNVAMERSSAHANTIYRCFAQTRDANVADLEVCIVDLNITKHDYKNMLCFV